MRAVNDSLDHHCLSPHLLGDIPTDIVRRKTWLRGSAVGSYISVDTLKRCISAIVTVATSSHPFSSGLHIGDPIASTKA